VAARPVRPRRRWIWASLAALAALVLVVPAGFRFAPGLADNSAASVIAATVGSGLLSIGYQPPTAPPAPAS
jgi:hypothetical protein